MKTDVAIVGGGPGGSAAAIWLRRKGLDVVMVERDTFPRFHIGESFTGECGQQVRALGLEEQMGRLEYPVKYGTAVYGANGSSRFYVPVMGRRDDGTLTPGTTWQVRRSSFDAMIQSAALDLGAGLVEGKATRPLVGDDGGVTGVAVKHNGGGKEEEITARAVIDASGQGKFLAHAGVTTPVQPGRYFRQVAFFGHFAGAIRDEGQHPLDTVIFYRQKHHWAWFIPIDDEVTSIGVVVPSNYYQASNSSPDEFFLREVRALNPELTRRIEDARPVEPIRSVANFSYRVDRYAGPGFMCVGDSHRFIDPIFSFGLFVSLAEAQRAAEAVSESFEDGDVDGAAERYQAGCDVGLERFQHLIDAFWNNPLGFAVLVHQRYPEDLIDLFAGRVYDDMDSPGMQDLRSINERARVEGRLDAIAVPEPA